MSNTQKLEKELKMNRVLCAFVKTIVFFVFIAGSLGIIHLFFNGIVWVLKNVSGETILLIIYVLACSLIFLAVFMIMYGSCNQSND